MTPFSTRRGAIAALIAMLLADAGAAAQIVAPANAPASWNAYSILLHNMVQVWLADNSDAALRLSAYLEGIRAGTRDGTMALPLDVWIDARGGISDIRFPFFAHEQANADMLAVLRGREMPEAPPPDMAQPVHLRLMLRPKADG